MASGGRTHRHHLVTHHVIGVELMTRCPGAGRIVINLLADDAAAVGLMTWCPGAGRIVINLLAHHVVAVGLMTWCPGAERIVINLQAEGEGTPITPGLDRTARSPPSVGWRRRRPDGPSGAGPRGKP